MTALLTVALFYLACRWLRLACWWLQRSADADTEWLGRHYRSRVHVTLQGAPADGPTATVGKAVLSSVSHRIPALLRVPVKTVGKFELRRLVLPPSCEIVAVARRGEVLLIQDCPVIESDDEVLAFALMPRYAPLLKAILQKTFA
ncbi:MAG: hypothetical protein KME03_02280 [Aphanocapsa lilacina HA4352-LM1]|nr:hypothetical protein [Aphanocapsa lilacina HA4352-LM1]